MTQKIIYFIKPDGRVTPDEYRHVSNDLEMVAESYVEEHDDYYGDYGGENELEIFDSDMKSLGLFMVSKEYVVHYSSYKKRGKNEPI